MTGGRRHVFLFLLPLLGLSVLVAGFALALRPGRDPHILPSALIDQPAPAFTLPSVYADRPGLSTSDLKGGVSVVNVFASWCLPCRSEHAQLKRLAAETGVALYGINWKDQADNARTWLAELGDPYRRVGFDPSGRAGIDWGVYGVPETYVVDRDGRIRYKHVGPLTAEDIDTAILPVVHRLAR